MTAKRKRILFLLVVIIVVGMIGGAALSRRKPVAVVQTGRVERVELLESIVSASGEIRAKEFVDLQTEIAGVIVELPVKEGARVTKGEVLLKIDPFQTRSDADSAQAVFEAVTADAAGVAAQVATAKAQLARDEFFREAAKTELVQTETSRDRLKSQYDRKKGLYEKQVISIDEFEATESAFRVAESQVATSKARVDQAEAQVNASSVAIEQTKSMHEAANRRAAAAKSNLDRMLDWLQKTTILSPLDGVITRLNVEKGERAVPGILSNPEATLMTIADLSVIEAEIKVDETDIINVSLDDRATVTIDALPDAPLQGHVTEIGNSPIGGSESLSRSGSSSQEGKDFKVVVRIENPPASLRPGLSASAEILVDRRENVLVIPLQALTMREVHIDSDGKYVPPDPAEAEREADQPGDAHASGLTSDDRKVPKKELEGVFFHDGARARFRPIKLGIKGESDVEVLEGLAEGEEIVTGSYKVLRTLKEADLLKVENREGVDEPTSRQRRSKRR